MHGVMSAWDWVSALDGTLVATQVPADLSCPSFRRWLVSRAEPKPESSKDAWEMDPAFALRLSLGSTTLTAGSASSTSHPDDPLHG